MNTYLDSYNDKEVIKNQAKIICKLIENDIPKKLVPY